MVPFLKAASQKTKAKTQSKVAQKRGLGKPHTDD